MAKYSVIMNSVAVTAAQDLIRITAPASARTYATDVLTGTGTVANNETVTVGGKVYTFQTTLTNSNGNVLIGANLAASLQNLYDAINLTGTVGTQYATLMTVNDNVTAAAVTATTLTVQAKAVGDAGNAIAATEAVANASWATPTLTGGTGQAFALGNRGVTAAKGFYVTSIKVRSDDSETANQVSLGMYVGISADGIGTIHIPRDLSGSNATFIGTALVNLTTATTKAPAAPLLSPEGDLASEGLNWYVEDAEEGIYVGPGGTFVLRLDTAPAASTTITAVVEMEQF